MRLATKRIVSLLTGLSAAAAALGATAQPVVAPGQSVAMYTFQGGSGGTLSAYKGPCPAIITFEGSITTTGPGLVDYSWAFYPGPTPAWSQDLTATYKAKGTHMVSHTYTFTKSVQTGFVSLHATQSTQDAHTPNFSITCT